MFWAEDWFTKEGESDQRVELAAAVSAPEPKRLPPKPERLHPEPKLLHPEPERFAF